MSFAVDAVWQNNGYQKDPVTSEAKLNAAVSVWNNKGFRLHDPSTWHNHKQAVVPELKLVWTASLLSLIPELVQIAHCDQDQVMSYLRCIDG
jgi:hypothetical protein